MNARKEYAARYYKKYYQENKERYKEVCEKWYNNNREKWNEYQNLYKKIQNLKKKLEQDPNNPDIIQRLDELMNKKSNLKKSNEQ